MAHATSFTGGPSPSVTSTPFMYPTDVSTPFEYPEIGSNAYPNTGLAYPNTGTASAHANTSIVSGAPDSMRGATSFSDLNAPPGSSYSAAQAHAPPTSSISNHTYAPSAESGSTTSVRSVVPVVRSSKLANEARRVTRNGTAEDWELEAPPFYAE